MKNFEKLTRNGLSMFHKAVENLEKASEIMLKRKNDNEEEIIKLEVENSDLDNNIVKNNKTAKKIRDIID